MISWLPGFVYERVPALTCTNSSFMSWEYKLRFKLDFRGPIRHNRMLVQWVIRSSFNCSVGSRKREIDIRILDWLLINFHLIESFLRLFLFSIFIQKQIFRLFAFSHLVHTTNVFLFAVETRWCVDDVHSSFEYFIMKSFNKCRLNCHNCVIR